MIIILLRIKIIALIFGKLKKRFYLSVEHNRHRHRYKRSFKSCYKTRLPQPEQIQIRKYPHTFKKGQAGNDTDKPRAGTLTAHIRNGKSVTHAMPGDLCKGLHKRPTKRSATNKGRQPPSNKTRIGKNTGLRTSSGHETTGKNFGRSCREK